jgi:probable addiction module antidote protein
MRKKISADYQKDLLARLKDPEYAAEYLNAAIVEDREVFLLALRNVAEAQGMAALAKKAHVNRESLYRTLSPKGNPQLSTLEAVLAVFGLQLAVQKKKQAA